MNDNSIKILVGVLAATVTILMYVLKRKDDEISLIKNKISDKKYSTYFEAITIMFDLLNQHKGLKKLGENELQIRYIDLKKNLLLLGSDEILLKFLEIDKSREISDKGSAQIVMKYLELFLLIRKDSGNPKTAITTDDLLKAIMASDKDYEDIKKLLLS